MPSPIVTCKAGVIKSTWCHASFHPTFYLDTCGAEGYHRFSHESHPIGSKKSSVAASPAVALAAAVATGHASAHEIGKATAPMSARDGAAGTAEDVVSDEHETSDALARTWKWF